MPLEAETGRGVDVDYRRRYGRVAAVGAAERVVALVSYSALDDERAEIDLAIADDYQGRGLGTLLLGVLAEAADENGISVFEGDVLPANHRMLDVLHELGFPVEVRATAGEVHFFFPTSPSEDAVRRFEQREQVAAANAVRAFLHPRSVAVIGTSRQRGTVGGEVLHNLLAAGFAGPVYAVNPAASVVQGQAAYPSVETIPGPVDPAVVAVPAPTSFGSRSSAGGRGCAHWSCCRPVSRSAERRGGRARPSCCACAARPGRG